MNSLLVEFILDKRLFHFFKLLFTKCILISISHRAWVGSSNKEAFLCQIISLNVLMHYTVHNTECVC